MIINKHPGARALVLSKVRSDKLDQAREAWNHLKGCYRQEILLENPGDRDPVYRLQAEILIQTIQSGNPNNFSRIRALLDCTDEEVERFIQLYALPGIVTLRIHHIHGAITGIHIERTNEN